MHLYLDTQARDASGRSIAALRGDTRDKLDGLLLHELRGTGIGRSAFIQAAIDHYRGLLNTDPWAAEQFDALALDYERTLPL